MEKTYSVVDVMKVLKISRSEMKRLLDRKEIVPCEDIGTGVRHHYRFDKKIIDEMAGNDRIDKILKKLDSIHKILTN